MSNSHDDDADSPVEERADTSPGSGDPTNGTGEAQSAGAEDEIEQPVSEGDLSSNGDEPDEYDDDNDNDNDDDEREGKGAGYSSGEGEKDEDDESDGDGVAGQVLGIEAEPEPGSPSLEGTAFVLLGALAALLFLLKLGGFI